MLVNLAANQPSMPLSHEFVGKVQVVEYPDGASYVDELRTYDDYGLEKIYETDKDGKKTHKMFLLKHNHPYQEVSTDTLHKIVSEYEQ